MKNLAVLVALPLALVACSGGGSGSSGGAGIVAPGASINSQFIDAPVKGLKVTKESGATTTGDNGVFNCQAGETITFAIHDKDLGTANCGDKIFVSDLNPGLGNSTDAAAALIQSLSKSVGGVLDLSTFNAAPVSLVAINLTELAIDSDINGLSLGTLGLTPVLLADAKKHVLENLPNQDNDLVLAALADQTHTLKLAAVPSNNTDHCWENVQVKVEVESIDRGTAGGTAYRFNVKEYLAWDGETIPTYDPGTDCDTDNNENFQCLISPVSKIMTGRSVAGAHYETFKFNIPQNSTAICEYSDDSGFEFNWNNSEVVCDPEDGETGRVAATALELSVGLGWNFDISVNDTSFSVGFTEQAVDIGAKLDADNKVTAYTQEKFNCSYSLTEALEVQESPAE